MARATDFLSQTSGKLDEMFQTRQTDHGTILARNPKRRGMTRRSEKQANTRCQLANVSANYQLFRCKKMQSFEGKEAGQNDFNIFVQVNYDRNPVFITKQDRKCGGCVLGNYQSGGSETPTVNAPTISGDTPFEESTEVTMSGPADATIHYTLDGSTPTSASTAYTEALTLTDTTTVKAIAVKDGVSSSVASRTFTKGSGSGGGLQGED